MKNKYFLIVILLLFLVLLILIFYYLFYTKKTKDQNNKPLNASAVTITGSLQNNSYIFASPVKASVDGDLIRVTVYLLDNSGYPIVDKKVDLDTTSDLDVKNVQQITDNQGRAIFDIGTDNKGKYNISFVVDGIKDKRSVNVTFE